MSQDLSPSRTSGDQPERTDVEAALLGGRTFRTLSEQEIQDYIASREPLDKAGAYGIQGRGGKFVEKLQGPYDNVVGLPLDLVRQMLAEWEEEDQ